LNCIRLHNAVNLVEQRRRINYKDDGCGKDITRNMAAIVIMETIDSTNATDFSNYHSMLGGNTHEAT